MSVRERVFRGKVCFFRLNFGKLYRKDVFEFGDCSFVRLFRDRYVLIRVVCFIGKELVFCRVDFGRGFRKFVF